MFGRVGKSAMIRGESVADSRILRVFIERTNYTPSGELVAIGEPGLFPPPDIDEIHVCCVFTWHLSEARRIVSTWSKRYPDVPVKLGGPALDDPGGEFVPGRYVRPGISINSRGCPNSCPWCVVPKREGGLRLLNITPGHIVQDNNVLAFPRQHFRRLVDMLQSLAQPPLFFGGLEPERLTSWHVDQLKRLRLTKDSIWLAADTEFHLPALRRAVRMLDLPRRTMRCYAMLGWNGESLQGIRQASLHHNL